ncbi:Acriflavine resistance protein F Protein envD [Salmonella enterica subsp. enterica]|uniref:Acriflavine resistance protein F Protein envD n=1 Tax=Salmonella enterica I TaxID=59201 RepID=A0A447N6I7_SALET|nr:Acriflavine resistance protein F Protein envD [Salmonella enterica subsp. enterica]
MTTSAVLTAIRLPVLALSWPPAQTKWRPRSWCWIASTSWRSTSLTAWNTRSRMKPPPLSKASIIDVVKTLLEAIALVFLVMYLFLQNFRATLIPTIAVPVVLMGTFSVLYAFGYSINTLTMFAMVLAIGLLVDDAIVVVENVERIMSEEGLTPREATRKSMGQIQGALVGIAMVLSAVFVPMAFFGGTTGAILSSVFYHHCLGNGAVGAGRHDPDTGAVRNVIKNRCTKANSTGNADFSAGLTVPSIVMPNVMRKA